MIRRRPQDATRQADPQLWRLIEAAKAADPQLLPAAGPWRSTIRKAPAGTTVGGKVADALATVNPTVLGPWLDAFAPVRASSLPGSSRSSATRPPRLRRHWPRPSWPTTPPCLLADLVMDADPKAFQILFPSLVSTPRRRSLSSRPS